jgi:hypothetical protein
MEYFGNHDPHTARTYLDQAIELVQRDGLLWASSFTDISMGHLTALLGDIETARIAFARSVETSTKLGNKRMAYSSQSEFAHILRQRGDLDEPLATYKDLLPKWHDLGHRSAVAHELECIAYIFRRKEEPERAVKLLGAADVIRKTIDSEMTNVETTEYEQEIAVLKEMLDKIEFNACWLEGQKITIDEAIELALGK